MKPRVACVGSPGTIATALRNHVPGEGTVYRMTPAGEVVTIHSFSGPDGGSPNGELLQGHDGWLYGTTGSGGAADCGVAFRLAPDGAFAVLHEFSCAPDGISTPYSALIEASDGNLYATSPFGGLYEQGSLFRMSLDGTTTMLHSFHAQPIVGDDFTGNAPDGITQGSDGFLYGVTDTSRQRPGCDDPARFYPQGCGGVYKMTLQGALVWSRELTSLQGDRPNFRLVEGPDGNFYGTTTYGGPRGLRGPRAFGYGTVIRVTPAGRVTPVHDFRRDEGDRPAGLTLASDGLLYGVTRDAKQGRYGGSVFRMALDGTLEVLKYFHGEDGFFPTAPMAQGGDGALYGVTQQGGTFDEGAAFRISGDSSARR